jgi:NAD(P)-dependent dehydrogenase (short-subunit alcohol dehydrogenase family)
MAMNETSVALVTGAAHGIGRACAAALAADGARVVLADLDGDAAAEAASAIGPDALARACDMGDSNAVTALFDGIEAEAGPVAILVNNAGVALPADFLDYSLDDWRRTLDVNLTGAFLATQRAARGMIANKIQGAVVNMSSINAQVAIPTIPAYCASKGGIAQLTKAAALALAPHGILVNAVAPGSIDTAMVAGVNRDPDAMNRLMSRTPMKRLGTAEEVARIVAFLAGPGAAYVTGETIVADGGRLALNYTC